MTREGESPSNGQIPLGGDILHYFFGWSGCLNYRIDCSATSGQEDDSQWEHICDIDEFIAALEKIRTERPLR